MSQTYDRNFYDDKTITATYPLTHPRIGYENLATSVTASSSLAGFPASYMLNPLTYELWKTSTFPATLTFDLNGAGQVDYVGLAAHQLAGFTVEVQTSTDDVTYTQRTIADLQDNGAAMLVFNEVTANYVRLIITGTGTGSLGVFYTGKCLEMPRMIYGGHSPARLSRNATIVPNKSDGGQWLGRSVIRRGEMTSFAFQNLKANWYRDNFDAFVEASISAPFFIAWRPERFANEVVYGQINENVQPSNQGLLDYMQVSFNVMGFRPLGPLVTRVEPVPLNAGASLDFVLGLYEQSGTSTTLDALTTYTRNSIASRVMKQTISAVDSYYIDTEYLGSTTNLVIQSEDLTDAAWLKAGNVSVTADDTIAPDGTTTADKLETSSTTLGTAYVGQDVTVTAGNHTLSFYAKAGTNDYIQLQFDNGDVSGDFYANIDLTSGTMSEFETGITSRDFKYLRCVNVGDDWYKITATFSAASTTLGFNITLIDAMNNARQYAKSWAVGQNVYLWGFQLTQGKSPYGYIPTAASAVADTLTETPRIDYDITDGSVKGLLIEPATTNLFTRSQEFDDTDWTKSASGAYPMWGGVKCPDGSYDACRHTNGVSVPLIYQSTIAVTNGAEYTVSIYAKKDYADFYQISFGSGHVTGDPRANFDLNTGVLGTVDSGLTASIESFNDWYRLIVTFTSATTALRVNFCMVQSASDSRLQSNTWPNNTEGVFIWGAQLEAGDRATSYVVSKGTQGFRVVDRLSMAVADAATFSDISTVFNVSADSVPAADTYIYDIATTAEAVNARLNTSGDIVARKGSADATVAASTDYTLGDTVAGVSTFSQSGGTLRTYLATAQKAVIDAGTAAPIDQTGNIQIGDSIAGGNEFTGHIEKLEFYNIVLTDQQISEL